jgi:hypothetical protein
MPGSLRSLASYVLKAEQKEFNTFRLPAGSE